MIYLTLRFSSLIAFSHLARRSCVSVISTPSRETSLPNSWEYIIISIHFRSGNLSIFSRNVAAWCVNMPWSFAQSAFVADNSACTAAKVSCISLAGVRNPTLCFSSTTFSPPLCSWPKHNTGTKDGQLPSVNTISWRLWESQRRSLSDYDGE